MSEVTETQTTLKKKSFSTVRATQKGSQHYMEKRRGRRVMTIYTMLISFLASKMRSRCIQLSGYDPYEIVLPFTNDQIHRLFVTSMDWQIATADFIGEVHNHFPKSPLITIAAKH